MREIKFRQYIKGIWHFWGFLENGVFIGPANNTSSEEQQEESQQFTGLKDKNGVEIYEGDLVRINNLTENWKYGEPNFDWRVFEIEYNQYTWAFNNSVLYMPMSTYKDRAGEFYDYEIEVIGNIFENHNLLTK